MHKKDHFLLKTKALNWANSFNVCCYLDTNNYKDSYGDYECLIAVGNDASISENAKNAFETLKQFRENNKDWAFGFLGYDLKNELEDLSSKEEQNLGFPDLYFFKPTYVITLRGNEIKVIKGHQNLEKDITSYQITDINASKNYNLTINNRITKAIYLSDLKKIKDHITRGDIYEINYCQDFFVEQANVDPLSLYERLNNTSPTPQSAYFRLNNKYLICASPERFLKKTGSKLISQPIKGTAKRHDNKLEDNLAIAHLKTSAKERAENVMIVDLVRNDLTKSAKRGTVKVDELFGIYSFPQVHQMISTVSCEINPNVNIVDAIKNTFPMGSMTGAPKLKAMELIDKYEHSKRGLYSGAIGYISPNDDFDFNVVIRSILYNSETQYLSYQVGGAITYQSDPEKEYEESILKASAILNVLTNKKSD